MSAFQEVSWLYWVLFLLAYALIGFVIAWANLRVTYVDRESMEYVRTSREYRGWRIRMYITSISMFMVGGFFLTWLEFWGATQS